MMPRASYTRDQLQQLRGSPLVRRPETLPQIEQWIEQSNDQAQRRPRPQSGIQNVKEENAQPAKRPPLGETRLSARHSYQGSGEDIFLGPKTSFASASAARQTNKSSAAAENHTTSATPVDSRLRPEREQASKDRAVRDGEGLDDNREYWRQRFNRVLGGRDEATVPDSRAQVGQTRNTDNAGRSRPRLEDSDNVVMDDGEVKRGSGVRTRQDQTRLRDGKRETKESDNLDSIMSEKSWRGRERQQNNRDWAREAHVEQEPQWLNDSLAMGSEGHTVHDFQKWKDSMKATAKADERHMIIEEDTPEPSAPAEPLTPPREQAGDNATSIDLFKAWAGPKSEEPLPGPGNATPKAASKPKASRFAGFFAPTQQEAPNLRLEPPPPGRDQQSLGSPVEPIMAPKSSADEEGFARMMQMLRMGNNAGSLPSGLFPGAAPNKQQGHGQAPSIEVESAPVSQRQSLTSPLQAMGPQPPLQQPQASKPIARPEPVNRDSEFLLKLMQQQYQQPKSPFTEGQIYGQSYNRKDSADLSGLLKSLTPRPINQQLSQQQAHPPLQIPSQPPPQSQQQPQVQQQNRQHAQAQQQPPPQAGKSRGAPPGFFGNERAYGANQQIETMNHEQNPLSPVEGRLPGMPQRYVTQDPRLHPMQMPPFEQQVYGARTHGSESVPMPPGFASASGPAPPGFFQFPGGHNGGVPQGMRQSMPAMPPPNFYNGAGGPGTGPALPPGYGPLQTQQQQQSTQARRMSQLQSPVQMMPPGYEAMAQANRRPPGMMPPGIRPPSQGQYPPYLKQGGGVGY